MKKTRLFIAMLVMLVAASGYAQDSYREAVKDYLTAIGQFEKTKSLLADMKTLFKKSNQVDINQLTQRYLGERFEDDMLDSYVSEMTEIGMSEADLREVASLVSTPEGKIFSDHEQEWMAEFLAEFMMPFMMLEEDEAPAEAPAEDKDWSSGGLADLLGKPVQPRADIDPAYAAKFKDVILESPIAKNIMDAMMKRMDEDSSDESKKQEERKAFTDWMVPSMSALLLNSAYGNLTLEDLDYAAKLYANKSYCKLGNYGTFDNDKLKMGYFVLKYLDWMKEQGATLSEDPQDAVEFFKLMFNLDNLDIDK